MKKLNIVCNSGEYPIYYSPRITELTGDILRRFFSSGVVSVVSDTNVMAHYSEMINTSLINAGLQPNYTVLEPGEKSKSNTSLEKIYKSLYENSHRRDRPLVAFGGGVIGDVAGFAAATYMRGVPLVQIPSTLLAQVDSSIGGKVAIDSEYAKNIIGAFYQPRLVLSDTALLNTLPEREFASGMAEVIKYGLLVGGDFLEQITNYNKDGKVTGNGTDELIYRCCEIKKQYVEKDEKDTGIRMELNYGHSFAHAIERLGDFSLHTHGEAVAIGMFMAAKVGYLLGYTSKTTVMSIKKLLVKWNLPLCSDFSTESIVENMLLDKKNTGNTLIKLILLKNAGSPFIKETDTATIIHALKVTETL